MAARILLVLCAAFVAQAVLGELIADDPEKCLNTDHQSVIELSNTGEQALRICYSPDVSSIVQLDCNWEKFQFEVQFDLTAHTDPRRKVLPSLPSSPAFMSKFNTQSGSTHQECDKDTIVERQINESYSYLLADDNKNQPKNMVIRDGKLYYETSVFLIEYLWNTDCNGASPVTTEVKLSCCAIPQEAEVTPVVIPPLNVECELDGCKLTRNAKCDCTIVEDNLQLYVSYNQPLDNTFGFQLLGVIALANGSAPSNGLQLLPPVPANGEARLDLCDVHPSTPNPTLHYASRSIAFNGKPGVQVQCQVQLCAKNEEDETATRPLCVASAPPVDPKPPKCYDP